MQPIMNETVFIFFCIFFNLRSKGMRDPLQDQLPQLIRPCDVILGRLGELELSDPLQSLRRRLLVFLLERGGHERVRRVLGTVLDVESEAKLVISHFFLVPFLFPLGRVGETTGVAYMNHEYRIHMLNQSLHLMAILPDREFEIFDFPEQIIVI